MPEGFDNSLWSANGANANAISPIKTGSVIFVAIVPCRIEFHTDLYRYQFE